MSYTTDQILSFPADTPITAFSGTLTQLWPRKAGTSARGEWSIQNGSIKDSQGKELKIVFKDRPELPQSFRNKQVTITAKQGDKGWTGVKTKDDTFEKNGQSITTRVLWVTPTAEVIMGVGPLQQTPPAPQIATPPAQYPPNIPNPTYTPQVQTPAVDPVFDTQQKLIQLGNLYLMCLDQTVVIAKEHERRHNIPVPAEQFQAIASSLWICATKERFQDSLPKSPMYAEQAASEPQQ